MTVMIVNRGDRLFRRELLSQVQSIALGETLWVNGPDHSLELETLSHEFPLARFLLIANSVTAGEMVNIGISEARARYVLCMWSDARIASVSPALISSLEEFRAVCVLPTIRTSRAEQVPSYQSPQLKKGKLSLRFRTPTREGEKVFFPFDYCAIYDRERFKRAGGYDPAISNPYWQKIDFGFRCHLWEERICGTGALALTYAGLPASEDATPDGSYKAFYLKNLAVRLKRDYGVLPLNRLLEYMLHSDTGPSYAFKEFSKVREWVRKNKFRFRHDPRKIVEGWGTE
jgi:hypothetical protein